MPREPGVPNTPTATVPSVMLKKRGEVRGTVSSITPNDQMTTAWKLSRMTERVWGFKMAP